MAISNSRVKNEVLSTWSNAQMGTEQLDNLIAAIVNAVLNEIKTYAEFKGHISGGGCTHSGQHPPSTVVGLPGCLK